MVFISGSTLWFLAYNNLYSIYRYLFVIYFLCELLRLKQFIRHRYKNLDLASVPGYEKDESEEIIDGTKR